MQVALVHDRPVQVCLITASRITVRVSRYRRVANLEVNIMQHTPQYP
jgi:hypothetical protein